MRLCTKANAFVVVSSNWRRFEDDGEWSYRTPDGGVHKVKNQMPALKAMLGERYAGTLPVKPHVTKSKALLMWFDEHPSFNGSFVVLDDDLREGFQSTLARNVHKHFILTDYEWGLTERDVDKAMSILGCSLPSMKI